MLTKHPGEVLRLDLTHHDVAVRDGQRAATAIALWPRIGTGTFRADTVARAIKIQNRTAARSNRMNLHHWCPDTNPGQL